MEKPEFGVLDILDFEVGEEVLLVVMKLGGVGRGERVVELQEVSRSFFPQILRKMKSSAELELGLEEGRFMGAHFMCLKELVQLEPRKLSLGKVDWTPHDDLRNWLVLHLNLNYNNVDPEVENVEYPNSPGRTRGSRTARIFLLSLQTDLGQSLQK